MIYEDHTRRVTVRLNGIADDGSAGEGDNVIGPVTAITGGDGNDYAGGRAGSTALIGHGGNDVLIGSPRATQWSAAGETTSCGRTATTSSAATPARTS